MSNEKLSERLKKVATTYAVWIGLLLRIFLAWLLPLLLDEGGMIPGVAYTDIDYHVFSDAAAYIKQGQSPYNRHTYRYTPFLAALLAHLPYSRTSGRYLFCLADALCGWIIVKLRQRQRDDACVSLPDALWWLYNPLAINICTRGSAESLVVLLPVLLTVWILLVYPTTLFTAALAGMTHGIAVHAKLYPIIYSLSFAVVQASTTTPSPTNTPSFTLTWIVLWIRRLFTPRPIMFALVFLLTFLGLTYLAVHWYGRVALEEGLLYHFSRTDHRHNYSMHWYWIYLARGAISSATSTTDMMTIIGRLLLVPQLVVLVYTSLSLAPYDLSLALFVQTFCFVAQNKVITAQYFTWYLCLLPLCNNICWNRPRLIQSTLILFGTVGVWLGTAYCLEMKGWAVHRLVWMASIAFFAANVNLLDALLSSVDSERRTSMTKQKKA